MAVQRDRDDEELSEKEMKDEEKKELIANLKKTKQMFFAYVPKGSLGKLVVCETKRERDEAAKKLKSEISGDTPLMGTCVGSITDKIFRLEKQPGDEEKLGNSLQKVIKLATKLAVEPTFQDKRGKPFENADA